MVTLRPCPHERGYFQNRSFFCGLAVRPHANTAPGHWNRIYFFKLQPRWRFSKTPAAVLSYRHLSFWLVTSEPALLSPPTRNFFRLLIGQHGFTVEIISPPVGLACSWPFFKACICFSCGQRFFFLMKEGKTWFIKIPVYVWSWLHPHEARAFPIWSFYSPRFKNYLRTHAY